jgi:hypothetical protein
MAAQYIIYLIDSSAKIMQLQILSTGTSLSFIEGSHGGVLRREFPDVLYIDKSYISL